MLGRRRELTGSVVSITYPAHGAKPRVEVTLQVENTVLQLIFLSRTDLKSLDIGQQINVRGALVNFRGVPTMFNPQYIIQPEVFA